ARLPALLEDNAVVVDTRPAGEFATGHIPGTINLPLNRSFTTWAGWLLPYDREFYLIVSDSCSHCIAEAARDLAMIGLDNIGGYFGTGIIEAWKSQHRPLHTVPQTTAAELADQLEERTAVVLDVRGQT